MVFSINDTTNPFEALLAVEGANDFQVDANNTSQFNVAGIGNSFTLSGAPISAPVILSVLLDRTGIRQAQVFIAGAQAGSGAYSVSHDTSAALHLMINRSRNAWVNGAVGEAIVTGDVSNRADYHSSLAAKWGLF